MSPARVRFARLLVEVAHLVVQQEPGALDDDVRSEAAFERVGARDGHAGAIDHREVGRLVRLRTLRGGDDVLAELDAARGFVRLIDAPIVLGVLFRGELRDRDADEIGVAQVPRSIEIRAAHRLDLEVDGRRGQQPLLLQVERFEDVQHLDERDTPELGGGIVTIS